MSTFLKYLDTFISIVELTGKSRKRKKDSKPIISIRPSSGNLKMVKIIITYNIITYTINNCDIITQMAASLNFTMRTPYLGSITALLSSVDNSTPMCNRKARVIT